MCPYVVRSACALGWLFATAAASADQTVSIDLKEVDGGTVISVAGLDPDGLAQLGGENARPADLARLLTVYAGEEPAEDQPAVLGTVRFIGNRLIFRPRYPFKPGLAYRVVFRPPAATEGDGDEAGDLIARIVRVEAPPAVEPTVVQAVYPSGDVLPENLLKFYVHFSAPMAQGDVYRYVRLMDASDTEVEYPFVNLGQELWDRSGTRVTLLLDPGRIKRGLRPREEVGPILEEGRAYELVIDGGWPDADGRPLADNFRKPFRAAAPDDVQPDPSKWQITPPSAGTLAPLSIRFAEPLDHAMLHSAFAVLTEPQTPISGTIQVGDDQTTWRFVPKSKWTARDYVIAIDASLEDRAGNSIERPFEMDVFERVQARVTVKKVSLPFRVR